MAPALFLSFAPLAERDILAAGRCHKAWTPPVTEEMPQADSSAKPGTGAPCPVGLHLKI